MKDEVCVYCLPSASLPTTAIADDTGSPAISSECSSPNMSCSKPFLSLSTVTPRAAALLAVATDVRM